MIQKMKLSALYSEVIAKVNPQPKDRHTMRRYQVLLKALMKSKKLEKALEEIEILKKENLKSFQAHYEVVADLQNARSENVALISQIYELKVTEASTRKMLDAALSNHALLHQELSKLEEKVKERDREVVVLRTKLDAALMENADVNFKNEELRKERDMESKEPRF